MRKFLLGLGFVVSLTVPAGAACVVSAGATVAQIQTALNSAGAHSCASPGTSTVTLANGSYTITSGMTLPCGVTVTAAVPADPSNVIFNATFSAESTDIFNMAGSCSSPTTISYLSILHAGLVFVETPNTGLTITHDTVGDLKCCNSQIYDPAIYINDPAQGETNNLANATMTWNHFGDATSCTTPTNAFAWTTNDEGPDGACTAMTLQSSVNGLVFNNNVIYHVGEGVHIICYGDTCDPPAGPQTINLQAWYNDISSVHRIAWEEQAEKISGVDIEWNVLRDWLNPYFGSFGFSMACCANPASYAPYLVESNNVVLFDTVPTPQYGVYGYGFEAWGNQATYAHNLMETSNYTWASNGQGAGPGMAWGYGMQFGGTVFGYNTVCGPVFATQGYIVSEGFAGVPAPTLTGNATTPTCPTVTSAAPAIAPSSGAHAFPLTVTVTDAGYSSGTQPLGNTGIWYTTDGTTPVPGSGSAQYLGTGQTFVLAGPATVQAVGMWGASNQPASYASGYGFVKSAVVSAVYTTSGGTVTLSSATIAPTGGSSSLQVGGTVQMIVTCHYSDGSTTGCNTTDTHGNAVTSWASNSGNVTVSASGLATGAAVGTATITATVTGGTTTSPGTVLTVSASPLTLSSISLATTGGVSAITVGNTNQLVTTCHYNDGTTTACNTIDSHGNAVTAANSSAPTIATVTSPGALVTGVAAGSTNLTTTVTPTPSMLGTSLENVTGATGFGYINEIYGVTGTSASGYTPGDCHITIPATTNWTAGKQWTCLLVLGTPTTQNAAALCSNSFTLTGTSWPGGDIVIPMASVCPSLPADTGYWVGSTTSQTTASPTQGFSNCNSQCSGGAPAFGSGTYPYRYVANSFGTYTSLPATLTASGTPGQQVSQYLLLTTTPVTSNTLPLTVNAAPPALVSAYLTGTSSLVVGSTAQLAAKCRYSSGADQDCTIADIYGDAVSMWLTSDVTEATVGNVGSAQPGLVTAVAAGTPSITAVINNAMNSTAFAITVTNPAVSLTGVVLSTAGGVTGLFIGATNQLKATCTYSDGSSDDCTNTDAHGNKANTYASSVPAKATVNAASGLVTGVAAGSTNLTAHAGSFTSNALPLSVFPVLSGVYTITVSGAVRFSGTVRF